MYFLSSRISPVMDTLIPRYLKAFVGSKYVIFPPPIVRSLTQSALRLLKLYPDISDFLRFTLIPDQSEKLSTVSKSVCIASLLSVRSVLSSANSRVLYSSPELCWYPPPLLSSHLIRAFTTTPPRMGDRGHPCLSPLSNRIFAVTSPLPCATWK